MTEVAAPETPNRRLWMPGWLERRLSGRTVLQKILSNSGWLLLDQILRVGVGAVLGIWVARYLGPERLGAYTYAAALISLVAPIALAGLDQLVVRDLVQFPDQTRPILSSAVALRLGTAGLSVVAALGLATVLREGNRETLVLTAIMSSAALFQAFAALDFWFQAQLRQKYSVIARDLAFLVSAATKVVCVLGHAPIEVFGMAVMVEAAVGGGSLWVLYRRVRGDGLDLRLAQWRRIKAYLLEARSLVATGLLIAVFMRIDRVVIGAVLNNEAVGLYSVAVQLCEVFFILPNVLLSSLYPVFIDLYNRDQALYTRRLIQTMRGFFYAGLLIAVIFLFGADWIVDTMFGHRFDGAIPMTRVYMFVLPLVGMNLIFSHRYVLNGTTRSSLIGVAVSSVVSAILNIVVVPVYGPLGAAWVALIAQAVPTTVITVLVDRSVGPIFLKAMLPSLKA